MTKTQASNATTEAATAPAWAEKTATGVSDTWSEANMWETNMFTTEFQKGERYTQADPIGIEAEINLYVYSRGNPTNFTDTLGLNPDECCWCESRRWILSGMFDGYGFETIGKLQIDAAFVKCEGKDLNIPVHGDCRIANTHRLTAFSASFYAPGIRFEGPCHPLDFFQSAVSIPISGAGRGIDVQQIPFLGPFFSDGEVGSGSGFGIYGATLRCRLRLGKRFVPFHRF